jgi:RNA polymerase sigma-70 factor (ECF subfamily)
MAAERKFILARRRLSRMEMNRSVDALRDALLSALLRKARAGSAEELGRLFEACRGYLLAVARQRLAASLRAKADAADLVQETFTEALRDFPNFRGETGRQLLGWLRGILRHNLADLAKRFDCCCRTVSQEVPLPDPQQLAAARIRAYQAVGGPICEQLIAQEQRRALDAALHRLPPLYRRVIQLHFGERCSFSEIGNGLQRSPEAVRKLVGRAVERLRQEMRVHAVA